MPLSGLFSKHGRWAILALALTLLAVVLWLPEGGFRSFEQDIDRGLVAPENFDVESLQREKIFVVGHRGAAGLKPGNTLPSVEVALDHGVDAIEIDVVVTGDGVPLVAHDPYLFPGKCRLDPLPPFSSDLPLPTGESFFAVPVGDMNFQTLRNYVCDGHPIEGHFPEQDNKPTVLAGDDFRPPRLGDIFEFTREYANSSDKSSGQRENARNVRFIIDLKSPAVARNGELVPKDPRPVVEAVLEELRGSGITDRVIVQFHKPEWLLHIESELPEVQLSYLSRGPFVSPPVGFDVDFWAPDLPWVSPELIRSLSGSSFTIIPWMVNDAELMRAVLFFGAGGFITDRPDIADALLRNGSPSP